MSKHIQPCLLWLMNECNDADNNCKKPHTKEHMDVCAGWKAGMCHALPLFGYCRFRHYYLDRDQPAQNPPQAMPQPDTVLEEFSSPFVERITSEIENKRIVEVDMETGRKSSYIEVLEHEVIDLTGQSCTPRLDCDRLKEIKRSSSQSRSPARMFRV